MKTDLGFKSTFMITAFIFIYTAVLGAQEVPTSRPNAYAGLDKFFNEICKTRKRKNDEA